MIVLVGVIVLIVIVIVVVVIAIVVVVVLVAVIVTVIMTMKHCIVSSNIFSDWTRILSCDHRRKTSTLINGQNCLPLIDSKYIFPKCDVKST
jgi:hypothetical protein